MWCFSWSLPSNKSGTTCICLVPTTIWSYLWMFRYSVPCHLDTQFCHGYLYFCYTECQCWFVIWSISYGVTLVPQGLPGLLGITSKHMQNSTQVPSSTSLSRFFFDVVLEHEYFWIIFVLSLNSLIVCLKEWQTQSWDFYCHFCSYPIYVWQDQIVDHSLFTWLQ